MEEPFTLNDLRDARVVAGALLTRDAVRRFMEPKLSGNADVRRDAGEAFAIVDGGIRQTPPAWLPGERTSPVKNVLNWKETRLRQRKMVIGEQ
jgi:hypothetical protein